MRGGLMFCFGLLLFTLSWVFIHGYPEPQLNDNGANNTKFVSGLIIGGQRAKPGDAPEAVAIRKKATGERACSGAIFHKHWVMSAAHCSPETNKEKDFVVVAGDLYFTDLYESRSVHSITRNVEHPRWQNKSAAFDMRLLKVKPDFKFDGKFIRQAPIANCYIKRGDKCRFGGWGVTYKPNHENKHLQWMKIEITNIRFGCAFFRDPHMQAGACYGDSGSGVICNGMLTIVVHGTVSEQHVKCEARFEDVGPGVRKERAWIEQVIGEKLPPEKNTYCFPITKSGTSLPSLPAKGPVWFSLLWSFIMLKHF